MRIIGTIEHKKFTSIIREDDRGRVYFVADGDIDADGANGQNGGLAAYRKDGKGSEALENGGMKINSQGKVYCWKSWARDIVILGKDNEPKIFPGGIIGSKTWYRHPGKMPDELDAYVDAETVPYLVVPPIIVQNTKGIVRGCRATVTGPGGSVDCVVADLGPAKKIGELSIAAARAIGVNSNPRNGGTSKPELLYELWPGIAAPGYFLQRS